MRRFRFHWRDGKIDEGDGRDVADAFSRLGYGGGAIRALDWHEDITTPEAERTAEDEILRQADAIRDRRAVSYTPE